MSLPEREPPSELFHYTTASSLFNIVRTKELWATSVQFMNDGRELTLAIDRVAGMLRMRAACEPLDVSRKLTGLAESVGPHLLAKDRDMGTAVTVCAVSLSAEGDLLSQWRAYSESASGCAIGFRSSALKDFLANTSWQLARCRYTEDDQDALLATVIDQTVEMINSSTVNLLENFWTSFLGVAPLIKHPGFHEESEWRILSRKVMLKSLDFRSSPSMVIPYSRLDLGSNLFDVIARVRIGPHPHQELAMASAAGFLENTLEVNMLVDASAIPYRPLR